MVQSRDGILLIFFGCIVGLYIYVGTGNVVGCRNQTQLAQGRHLNVDLGRPAFGSCFHSYTRVAHMVNGFDLCNLHTLGDFLPSTSANSTLVICHTQLHPKS